MLLEELENIEGNGILMGLEFVERWCLGRLFFRKRRSLPFDSGIFPFFLGGSEDTVMDPAIQTPWRKEEWLLPLLPKFSENQFLVSLPCSIGASLHVSFLNCEVE